MAVAASHYGRLHKRIRHPVWIVSTVIVLSATSVLASKLEEEGYFSSRRGTARSGLELSMLAFSTMDTDDNKCIDEQEYAIVLAQYQELIREVAGASQLPKNVTGRHPADAPRHHKVVNADLEARTAAGPSNPPPWQNQSPDRRRRVLSAGNSCAGVNVTFRTVTKGHAYEISWYIDDDCKAGTLYGTSFASFAVRDTFCCRNTTVADVRCLDSYGDGWHGAYLETTSVSTILLRTSVQLTAALTEVARPLTINGSCPNATGQRCIVDAAYRARLFDVAEGGSLRLEGLTLCGGYSAERGGGVQLAALAALHLERCVLRGCRAGSYGGGVYSYGGDVALSRSRLEGNFAEKDGGAVFANAPAVIQLTGGTSIFNNSCEDDGGGAALSGSVHLSERSAVTENAAVDHGGGIYAQSGSRVTLDASDVAENRAKRLEMDVGLGGGLVAYQDTEVVVRNGSAITRNTASKGGGMYLRLRSTADIRDSKVAYNNATVMGGGLCGEDNATVDVAHAVISNNSVRTQHRYNSVSGGGLFGNASVIRVTHTSLAGNALEIDNELNSDHATMGGAICAVETQLSVADSALLGNSARGFHREPRPPGHDVGLVKGGHGGGVAGIAGAIVIERSVISFGFAGEGGGVYSTAYSRVQGGTCESHGLGHITRALECGLMRHGVEGVEEEVVMTARAGYPLGCFLQRGMEEQELLVVNEGGAGGCSSELQCFCRGVGTLLVTATQVVENEASLSGGGLWVDFALNLSAHSVVSENHAAQVGGGVYAYNYTAITLQNRSEVVGNTAVSYRNLGGIYGETGVTVSVDNDSYVDSYTLVAAPPLPPPPPPPPLPPPLPASPSAPPVQVTNGTAVIMDPEPTYATAQLASVLEDPTVHTVLLLVNITLTASLPALAGRALTISGACGAGPCLVSGAGAFRPFTVLAGGQLRAPGQHIPAGVLRGTPRGVYANGSTVTLSGASWRDAPRGSVGGLSRRGEPHRRGDADDDGERDGKQHGNGAGGEIRVRGRLHCSGLNARTDNVRVLAGSEVRGNSAARNGGGIYIHRTCVLSVEASSVTGNVAGSGGEGGNGGGVAVSAATLTISGASAVSFNWARGEFGFELENMDYGRGGGIYSDGGRTIAVDSALASNVADSRGGGIATSSGLNVWMELTTAAVTGNYAGLRGGGIFIFSLVDGMDRGFELYGSVVARNEGARDGGGVWCDGFNATVIDSAVMNNTARKDGGGVWIADATWRVTNASFEGNTAAEAGGGLHLQQASLWMRLGRVRGNRAATGGGVSHVQDSEVEIHASELCGARLNGIGKGGGLALGSDSTLKMLGALVSRNTAYAAGGLLLETGTAFEMGETEVAENEASLGGGAWLDSGAHGAVRRCRFVANTAALDGGGIGLVGGEEGGARLELEEVVFEQQWAARGGGVFLGAMAVPAERISMHRLGFEYNEAVGENIFWIHDANMSDADQPECLGCTHVPANASLLATSPVAFDIVQDGVKVSGGGVGTQSGALLAPPLTYRAIDFYGNLTSLGSASGFVVVTSDTATLRGQTTAEYDPQLGAEVSMLTVTGEPGQGFSLVFSPSQEQWAQVVLPVTLVACAVGEQYIDEAGAQRCKKCGEGSIKFSNSTAPCASCTEMDLHEDALDCLGGSQFVLQDGYWMPQGWIAEQCTTAAGATSTAEECGAEMVLQQVYACAIPSRCESEEPHASAGNLSNLFDTALCAHGSRRDTVLCAGCDIHFFVGVDDQCTECPDAASTLTTAAGCLLGLVLLVAAARAGLHGYLGNSELQAQLLSARILAQLRGPDKSGILLSVLIGHIQIMAQTLTLFPANIVPDNYERFLGATEPFNLSVFSWLPVSCLTTALGMSYRVETYYWTLAFYASLPVLFSIPIVMSVLRARRLAAVEKGNALRPKIARLASVMSAPGAECSAMTELSLAATWAGGAVDEDTPALVRAVIDQGKETGQEDDAEARSSMTVVNPILRTLSEAQQDLPIGRSSSVNPRLLVRSESATATDRRRQERARTIRMEVEEGAMEAVTGLAGFAMMYAQPACATQMFSHFNCQEVHSEEGDYWLEMDHQVECYTFRWYIFRLVALLTIVIYILGLPVVLAVAPYVLRKYKRMRVKQSGAIIYVDQGGLQQDPDDPPEAFFMAEQATGRRVALEAQYEEKEGQRVVMTALHHPEAKLLLQYHLMPFKEHYFYWAAYDMGRKLAQTSVVLLVQEVDSQYDLLYSACLTTIALALHAQTRPYKIHIVNIFQTFVLVSQTLTISMLMGQRYASSDFGSSVVGIVAVILQVLLTGTMFAIIAVDMVRANWPTLAFLARTAADTAAVALRRAVACIHRRKHDTGHTAPKPIVARAGALVRVDTGAREEERTEADAAHL
ncbi:hypothetical protein CYMTET_30835 [Cymbomonas tetramitiformis]|uniref:Uncharacterized protein n=1 Tax=Cymbomonas tetramitiformis TaxID=36881 RepID=A0AAE0KTJ2_9CHLO|nr:hypothetical protein CYMTET_30835 [Cymbomonas tetramitiformis]